MSDGIMTSPCGVAHVARDLPSDREQLIDILEGPPPDDEPVDENEPEWKSRCRDRARRLALAQADDFQILGALMCRERVSEYKAQSLIDQMAMELQSWRWCGQAELSEFVWKIGKGESAEKIPMPVVNMALALGYQYLGFSRDGTVGEISSALQEKRRTAARLKKAGRRGPRSIEEDMNTPASEFLPRMKLNASKDEV